MSKLRWWSVLLTRDASESTTVLFGKWDDVKIMCRCRQFLLVLVSRHRSEEEACESKT